MVHSSSDGSSFDMAASGRASVDARDYLAVALDVASLEDAGRLIDRLAGIPGWLKVGSELFTVAGPAAVDLASKSARVFLDLKFYDIPNTVARAVAAATRCGASLLTLHASGGLAMSRAAAEAASEEADRCGRARPELVAITVLTSLAQEELPQVGVSGSLSDQVDRLVCAEIETVLGQS